MYLRGPFGTCGERYAHLVQVDGWGPSNPTGGKPWASEADVKAWLAVAKSLFDMVRARWNELITTENQRKDWTQSEKIRPSIVEFETSYAALPEPKWWQAAGQDAALAKVVQVAQAGACALELVEDANTAAGGSSMPVPYSPAPTDWFPSFDAGGDWILIVVLGVAAWAWFENQPKSRGRR